MRRVAMLLLMILLPAFLLPEGATLCVCELLRTRASEACCDSCCERAAPGPGPSVNERATCCCVVGAKRDVTEPAPVAPKSTPTAAAVALPAPAMHADDLALLVLPRRIVVLDASVRTVPRALTVPLRL